MHADMKTFIDKRLLLSCGKCKTAFEVESPAPCEASLFLKRILEIRCPKCDSKNIMMGQVRSTVDDDAYVHAVSSEPTVNERLHYWTINGEIGLSARAIAARLADRPDIAGSEKEAHPHDLSDLRRCGLLLRRLPEFRRDIHLMAGASTIWEKLAPLFEELIATLERETDGLLVGKDAPETAAILAKAIANKG
jgi:DNA-directed RNA polymerase subunit RPC12/RpoP